MSARFSRKWTKYLIFTGIQGKFTFDRNNTERFDLTGFTRLPKDWRKFWIKKVLLLLR